MGTKGTLLLLKFIRNHKSVISSNTELVKQQTVGVRDRVDEDIWLEGRQERIRFTHSVLWLLFELLELLFLNFDLKGDSLLFMSYAPSRGVDDCSWCFIS